MRFSRPTRNITDKLHRIPFAVAVCAGLAIVPINFAHGQGDEKKFGDVVVRGFLKASSSKTHQIELSADRSYQVTIKRSDASLATGLRVLGDAGEVLGDATGVGGVALEFGPVKDGVHRLVVQSTTPGKDGAYTMTIKTEEGFRTLVYTGQLTNNDGFDKVRKGCRFKSYFVRFQAGHTYIIDLEGNYDPYLRLEDSRGNNLKQDDDGGVGLNSRITYVAARTDKYRIIVTSCGQNRVGNFKLSVRRQGSGRTIFSTKGALTNKDAKDNIRAGSFSKAYAINLSAGRQYTIDLSSVQFNTYLRLENPRGNNLTVDDNSGAGTNARIIYRVPISGVYRIIANSSRGGETGNFTLIVREQ